ncbi:MAG: sigma-70 family RNA polymerase sigma factor [Leptolyngbyaceae cyanobacterium CSU_1_3]|nr:sigma-70 family RNA polymerase sigma factor [Leptolyngbyaceae cyanobacterium CSU_1_3]
MYQGKIPRRDFIEQFYTFLVAIVDRQDQPRTLKWRSDGALKQHFNSYQKQNSQLEQACQTENASAIVQEFLQLYAEDATPNRQRVIAQWHLAAYLEAPSYQAALDRFHTFKDYATPGKTWEHYLHIAKCLASDLDKVADIYCRHKPDKDSLDQHFRLEFASKIRDIFHQETGQGKYSIWYALKRISERELKRRLTINGIEDTKLPVYVAARNALFEVYSKSGDRWIEPSTEQYHHATEYFNRHYGPPLNRSLTLESFRLMLATCIKANQASPTIESLDDDKNKRVVTQEHLLSENPLTDIEEEQSAQDYQARLAQIDQILSAQLQQFDEKDQVILQLHAQGLNQTQIAAKVSVNQGTVSRRYQRSHRQLLNAIAEWVQAQHRISLTMTEHLAAYIELWLTRQYSNEVPIRGRGK